MTSAAPVYLPALGVTCALGAGPAPVRDRLLAGSQHGMVERADLLTSGQPITVGMVSEPLPELEAALDPYASRNAAILVATAAQIRAEIETAKARVGPGRVAVVMGSSTSGIEQGEAAIRAWQATGQMPAGYDIRRQEMGSVARLLATHLGLDGPAYTLSTACSSGAQALASARRLLLSGTADAVLAGGSDSLCGLTVNGFHALSALSRGICNPFSRNRDGTTIGEGAALFLVQREPAAIALLGAGSASDAYSMTAPEPAGRGLERAITLALTAAGLGADDIDYVQLHGTGTEQNDLVESQVIRRLFRDDVPCSSTKPQLGHCLGAAGALAAAVCWLTLDEANRASLLPPHLWDRQAGSGLLDRGLVRPGEGWRRDARSFFMANVSGFGGNNISLILGHQA